MTDDTIDESTDTAPPNHGKKGRGNRWMPSEEQRRQVKILSAIGTPIDDIAEVIGVSAPTLRRACKQDLRIGKVEAKIKARKTLFSMATDPRKPNVAALIFWLKCQDGWSERPDALTGETPAKKEERKQKAQQIANSGKLAPGRAPKLTVVKS